MNQHTFTSNRTHAGNVQSHLFEVVERSDNDVVTTAHKADGGQQLQHQRLRSAYKHAYDMPWLYNI